MLVTIRVKAMRNPIGNYEVAMFNFGYNTSPSNFYVVRLAKGWEAQNPSALSKVTVSEHMPRKYETKVAEMLSRGQQAVKFFNALGVDRGEVGWVESMEIELDG